MSDFEKLKENFKNKLDQAKNSKEVDTIRSEIFSKDGFINSEFKKIGTLPEKDKKQIATKINSAKQELTKLFNTKALNLEDAEIEERVKKKKKM